MASKHVAQDLISKPSTLIVIKVYIIHNFFPTSGVAILYKPCVVCKKEVNAKCIEHQLFATKDLRVHMITFYYIYKSSKARSMFLYTKML
jgi:hypothetical protein